MNIIRDWFRFPSEDKTINDNLPKRILCAENDFEEKIIEKLSKELELQIIYTNSNHKKQMGYKSLRLKDESQAMELLERSCCCNES